jgi:glutamate---cysteine ligase / carboxylate-amine ligase
VDTSSARSSQGGSSIEDLIERTMDDSDAAELAVSYERGFSRGLRQSIGLEEELILVDPTFLEPADEIESILDQLGHDERFQPELRAAQVEIATRVWMTVPDACRELADARGRLVEVLGGRLRIIAAGSHPLSMKSISLTSRPRYREIALNYPWVTQRGMPSGLHVHVGLDDSDEALAVYNAARSYLPELAALGANSPYFEGRDSGLASSRLKLVEDCPRTGIPPSFESWHDFARFVSRGAFGGLSYLWWDLRPRPDLGTLEFRVADTQTTVADTAAVAAVCQALVAALGVRFRTGERLPTHPSHLVNENRWRALRDGLAGELIDLETGAFEPTRDRLGRLLFELEPHAIELGSREAIAHAWRLLDHNGAERQRETAHRLGTRRLPQWLAEESEHSISERSQHFGIELDC